MNDDDEKKAPRVVKNEFGNLEIRNLKNMQKFNPLSSRY